MDSACVRECVCWDMDRDSSWELGDSRASCSLRKMRVCWEVGGQKHTQERSGAGTPGGGGWQVRVEDEEEQEWKADELEDGDGRQESSLGQIVKNCD